MYMKLNVSKVGLITANDNTNNFRFIFLALFWFWGKRFAD